MKINLPHLKNINPIALVAVLVLCAPSLCILLFRVDMGHEQFYAVAFPIYIIGIVAAVLGLVLLMFMGIALCLKMVQKSDNAHVAEAAHWKAIAEQAKTDRAAITNPSRLIEAQAETIDEADWRYGMAEVDGGPKWIK